MNPGNLFYIFRAISKILLRCKAVLPASKCITCRHVNIFKLRNTLHCDIFRKQPAYDHGAACV